MEKYTSNIHQNHLDNISEVLRMLNYASQDKAFSFSDLREINIVAKGECGNYAAGRNVTKELNFETKIFRCNPEALKGRLNNLLSEVSRKSNLGIKTCRLIFINKAGATVAQMSLE